MNKKIFLSAMLAASTIALASCGSGSSSNPTPSVTPTSVAPEYLLPGSIAISSYTVTNNNNGLSLGLQATSGAMTIGDIKLPTATSGNDVAFSTLTASDLYGHDSVNTGAGELVICTSGTIVNVNDSCVTGFTLELGNDAENFKPTSLKISYKDSVGNLQDDLVQPVGNVKIATSGDNSHLGSLDFYDNNSEFVFLSGIKTNIKVTNTGNVQLNNIKIVLDDQVFTPSEITLINNAIDFDNSVLRFGKNLVPGANVELKLVANTGTSINDIINDATLMSKLYDNNTKKGIGITAANNRDALYPVIRVINTFLLIDKTILIDTPEKARKVTLRNLSATETIITSGIENQMATSGITVASSGACATIAPSSSCDLLLDISKDTYLLDPETNVKTLTITAETSGTSPINVSTSGVFVVSNTDISIKSDSLIGWDIPGNNKVTKDAVVVNNGPFAYKPSIGAADYTITTGVSSGAMDELVTIVGTAEDYCKSGKLVSVGDSCKVGVEIKAGQTNVGTATLNITSGTATNANATSADFVVINKKGFASVTFADSGKTIPTSGLVGRVGEGIVVSIKNTGNSTIEELYINDVGADNLTISNNTCGTILHKVELAKNDTCHATIIFKAETFGENIDVLSVEAKNSSVSKGSNKTYSMIIKPRIDVSYKILFATEGYYGDFAKDNASDPKAYANKLCNESGLKPTIEGHTGNYTAFLSSGQRIYYPLNENGVINTNNFIYRALFDGSDNGSDIQRDKVGNIVFAKNSSGSLTPLNWVPSERNLPFWSGTKSDGKFRTYYCGGWDNGKFGEVGFLTSNRFANRNWLGETYFKCNGESKIKDSTGETWRMRLLPLLCVES